MLSDPKPWKDTTFRNPMLGQTVIMSALAVFAAATSDRTLIVVILFVSIAMSVIAGHHAYTIGWYGCGIGHASHRIDKLREEIEIVWKSEGITPKGEWPNDKKGER